MRGRKPTPINLRLIKGNPGKRPIPEEPKPPPAVPDKPDWLDEEASKEWDRVVPQLMALGILSRLDRAILVAYCTAWSNVLRLSQELEDVGWWIPTGEGGRKRNPAAASFREACERLQKTAAEFGMTPSSRVRLAVPGAAEELDPLEELMQRSASRSRFPPKT